MSRNKRRRNRQQKKQKKGNNMNIIGKAATTAVVERIKDVKDNNIFGIHLTTQKALDSFQEKSGMKGNYTVEYQHHYWAAVGRMQAGGQILDVAIPLVMYNYPQKVSGAAVKFDMAQVEDTSIQLTELAVAKCKEFMDVCGKQMSEVFGLEWSYVPTHTLHVHPGSLSSFSGTDYDKNPNDPGIVYPLSEATDMASFSSIMCHVGSKAKLVRTEYRLFTGTHEGSKEYRQGKCLSYVRRDRKENGPIEAMFIGNKAIEESYVFKDGFFQTQGDDLLKMFSDIFDASGFEPSTDFILEKNITRQGFGNGYSAGGGSYWPTNNKVKKQTTIAFNAGDDDTLDEYSQIDISKMRTFIVAESDFTWRNILNMEDEDVLFFYKEAVNGSTPEKKKEAPVAILKSEKQEIAEDKLVSPKTDVSVEDEKEEQDAQYTFLTEQGITDLQLMTMTDAHIDILLVENGYYLDSNELDESTDNEPSAAYLAMIENGFTDDEITRMTEAQIGNALSVIGYDVKE